MLIQYMIKKEKTGGEKSPLAYSSLSAKKEEYASALLVLFLLLVDVTQQTSVTATIDK